MLELKVCSLSEALFLLQSLGLGVALIEFRVGGFKGYRPEP